ncbi:RNA polymerase ECF-type sigma factor [hydrothermal vent metagenome]|uniref:RNA polymerase ECF-type sigma factor n=1 Tax=hydrothermal vent metagenome TaxID=652676 RepID=A0A3B0TSV1_9ZZZZ
MPEEIQSKVDISLVKRFANGDMKAFDAIYSVFNQKLQNFVFTLVKTEADTEEIVQEVFVKIWENRDRLKNYASFETYLFTIAYNTTMGLLRKRSKESQYIEYVKSVQVEVYEKDDIDALNIDEVNESLNLLIEKMPPRQREVFKMKHFKNYSYKEIATILMISVNTVENHVVKAHKYLKENLSKDYLLYILFINLFR